MKLTKVPSKTSISGSETFLYTFDVAFSDLVSGDKAISPEIIDIFPSYIDFTLPKLQSPFTDITTTDLGDDLTEVVFKLEDMNLGESFQFDIACSFGGGRSDGLVYTNNATLTVDGEESITATSDAVTLTLEENFRMFKSSLEGSVFEAGDIITFRLYIGNTGDSGATISSVNITDTLPEGLSPYTDFIPYGEEYVVDEYSDTSANGVTGTWDSNTLNFSIDSYSGSGYAVYFKVIVDDTVVAGQKITNSANWTVDGADRNTAYKSITIFEEKNDSVLTKNAPPYGTIGGGIQYRVLFRNTGTVEFNDYTITDTLPDEVNLTKVSFNPDSTAISSYAIEIATSDAEDVYTEVYSGTTSHSGAISLLDFIPDGERVVSLRVVVPNAKVSSRNNTIFLYGDISEDAIEDSTIKNSVTATATSSLSDYTLTKNANTVLNGISTLRIDKAIRPEQSAYYPLNEFLVVQTVNGNSGSLDSPIIADLLPVGISYASGNHYFTYFDALENKTYDSRNDNFPIIAPTPYVIEDYEGTGQTLVRFFFANFTLPYRNILTANFTAIVNINAEKTFTNYSYVGSPSDMTIVSTNSNEYLDTLDLDADGIYEEYIAQSDGVTGVVLTTSIFSIEKWVKGDLVLNYDKSSFATAGGDVSYKLCITNNQEDSLTNLEIVDILPHIGDTGVILNKTPRESQFAVYATSEVSVDVMNIITGEAIPTEAYTIEYSTSFDPIRFNEYGDGTIGVDEWSDTPPLDITTLASIKVTTNDGFVLSSYERLVVTVFAKIPVGTEVGDIAYNSYAVKANRINATTGETTEMLPVEPPKVWVQVANNLEDTGSIGEFVWEDYNSDGVFDDDEVGLNGVVVILFDEKKTELSRTVTADDAFGVAGYYEFNNLEAGNYYVKFEPIENFALTVQKADEENGSTPDPDTGLTNLITLTSGEFLTGINAGLIDETCDAPTIVAENESILVDSTFDALANVIAYDCLEVDLTSDIVVVSNTVDTSTVGSYEVVYSVTDSRGQTTTKTISVEVYSPPSNRYQAITDIITSVALEETALSHILNAEAEKIEKITSMEGVTDEEILLANKSVEQMVNSIASLELVLMQKLETVNAGDSLTP